MQEYRNLKLTGIFENVILLDIQIDQIYNDHARISIYGVVPDGDKDNYIAQMSEERTFSLVKSDNERVKVIFCALVEELSISHQGGVYHIELKGVSTSHIMDVILEDRSYQDIYQPYDEVIKTEMNDIDGQYINEDPQKDEQIATFTLHYRETKWDFIKRLVSRHNQGLLVDCAQDKASFWIGLPKSAEIHEISENSYLCYKKLQEIKNNKDNLLIDLANEFDFFCYVIPGLLDLYKLGDLMIFKDKNYRIIEIHSHLDKSIGALRHTYTITSDKGFRQPLLYNEQILGLSLEGTCIDRRKDFTKVHLYTIDEGQDVETASWFRQPTYYTAGKDRGWCAMPEIGDKMSLHFPTIEENDAYLLDSTHVPYENINQDVSTSSNIVKQNGGKKSDREIPASKYIIAQNGQNMILEDDLVAFESKDATSYLALYENHADEKGKKLGITLRTEGGIKINAENIAIGTIERNVKEISDKVTIRSGESINFVCALSSLIVDGEDGVHFKAPKIRKHSEIEFEE